MQGQNMAIFLLALLLAAPANAANDEQHDNVCEPSSFFVGKCTSKVATTLQTIELNSSSECCKRCAQAAECQTWTMNTRDQPPKCFLKGPVHGEMTDGSWCTTGKRPPAPAPFPTPSGAKNVLFMPVDDMRPMMNKAYNFSLAHTPHLDQLASEGLTFTRAYVQYAYCSPSRNSFMTGRRPDTTRVWEFVDHFREEGVGANWTSLPQYFKRHGGGKLYHPASATENVGMANNDYPASWSPEWPYFDNMPREDKYSCANPAVKEEAGTFCIAEVGKDESKLQDQKIRDNCIEHLHLAKNESEREGSRYFGKPFFVGCGFHKPHVPWHTPKEFFDLFPAYTDIPLAPPALRHAPQGMPIAAWHVPSDVKGIDPAFNSTPTCNETRAQLYRRAYYASVAYQDYNIGQVLATLDELNATATTVVLVFGDHGWQLGEHDLWAKMSCFELGTHIPLIIRAPWHAASAGKRTNLLTEMVDVYPSLAALTGLPDPATIGEQLNGTNISPVFDAPTDTNLTSALKTAAFSQFAKMNTTSVFNKFHRNQTKLMGYTIRVDAWRYTVWFPFDDVAIKPILAPATELGRELYTHAGNAGLWLNWPGENVNLVDDPAHAQLVASLHARVLDYIQLK